MQIVCRAYKAFAQTGSSRLPAKTKVALAGASFWLSGLSSRLVNCPCSSLRRVHTVGSIGKVWRAPIVPQTSLDVRMIFELACRTLALIYSHSDACLVELLHSTLDAVHHQHDPTRTALT